MTPWSWFTLILAIALAACVPTAPPSPTAAKPGETTAAKLVDELPTVTIAASRGLVSMPTWNMINIGPRYGFKVDIKVLITYADQQRAVAAGETDVATTGINNPAIIVSNNITNLRFIAGQQWGGQNIVMRKGVDVKSWKDLEGKKIGLAPGTWARVLFLIAARQHGVDLDKVEMVNVEAAGATALQALQRGELDGFVLFAPTTDRAIVEGYGYYPPDVDIGDVDFGDANGGLLANTAFLQKQELALNFMKAWIESITQMQTDQEAFVRLGTQVAGVSPEVARETYRNTRFSYNIDERAIVAAAKLGPEFGYAREDYSEQVGQILDFSLLERATGKSRAELSTPPPKIPR